MYIYTGGSKDPRTGRTVSTFVVRECGVAVRKRITDPLAVYMQWVEEVKPDRVVICFDLCVVLMSLQSFSSRSRQDLLYEVLQTHGRLRQMGIQTRFTWVLAHVGVEGNEAADVLAKQALRSGDVDVVVFAISKAEAKSLIWTVVVQRWQEQWNRDTMSRRLFQVQRKVGRGGRQEETEERRIFSTRLRVGHSRLNKTLNVKGKHPTRKCEFCQETERVEHVLLLCGQYEGGKIEAEIQYK